MKYLLTKMGAHLFSNDTDVCVLLLNYMYTFQNNELSELWTQYGTGNALQFIPINALYGSFAHTKSSVILKTCIVAGCGVTSKL